MTYRPTPFNLTGGLAFLTGALTLNFASTGGDGLNNFFPTTLLIAGAAAVMLDFLLQYIFRSTRTLILLESTVLIGIFLTTYFSLRQEQPPTFVFPPNYALDYIVVVYDQPGKPALYGDNKRQTVPDNGIVLTSSDGDDDRWSSRYEGTAREGVRITGTSMYTSTVDCNGRSQAFAVWYVGGYDVGEEPKVREAVATHVRAHCDLYSEK